MDSTIELVAHCVRIPVFVGREAVFIETERRSLKGCARFLSEAPGVIVVDYRANEGYVTPHEAAGEDAVYISRIRQDPTVPNGMVFWCVSDNLRKGAALNSVQIAELIAAQSSWALAIVEWRLVISRFGIGLTNRCFPII